MAKLFKAQLIKNKNKRQKKICELSNSTCLNKIPHYNDKEIYDIAGSVSIFRSNFRFDSLNKQAMLGVHTASEIRQFSFVFFVTHRNKCV